MDAYVWILVIEIFGDRVQGSRTRGLTESACLTLVQEVRSERTIAYCYQDGTPDPGWGSFVKPPRPVCAECWPLLPGRRRI